MFSGEEDLREREEAAGRRTLPGPAGPRLPEELQHVHLPRPLAVRPARPAPRRRVRLPCWGGIYTLFYLISNRVCFSHIK